MEKKSGCCEVMSRSSGHAPGKTHLWSMATFFFLTPRALLGHSTFRISKATALAFSTSTLLHDSWMSL